MTFVNNGVIIATEMKKNYYDITKLVSLKNFGKMKNLSRQRVYKLIESGKLDFVEIDGTKFVNLTKKSEGYTKQYKIEYKRKSLKIE